MSNLEEALELYFENEKIRLPKGTFKSILSQANLTKPEFESFL